MSEVKTKIISIANQKGGVAKTTSAVNISTALAIAGCKVLLIDLDPQGNASTGLGIDLSRRKTTIYDVIIGREKINRAIVDTNISGLKIICSNVHLSAAEIDILSMENREKILGNSLSEITEKFDYIIIDCPPSLGQLTINALCSSHAILVPMQCEFYALEGLSHLLKSIDLIQKNLNSRLRILGVLLTMHDKRNKITADVEQDVRNCLQDLVFDTVIPRNVRISEAPSHGMPVILYDPKCSGSIAYHDVAKEVILRERLII
jgi:chromosome partitioning protein